MGLYFGMPCNVHELAILPTFVHGPQLLCFEIILSFLFFGLFLADKFDIALMLANIFIRDHNSDVWGNQIFKVLAQQTVFGNFGNAPRCNKLNLTLSMRQASAEISKNVS